MESLFLVHLFHIFFVGPLFLYIGIYRSSIVSWLYPVLFILGIFIIAYHSFLAYKGFQKGTSIWVNLFHIFIVGPLLVYIGYKNKSAPRSSYQLLLMLAFAVIGYHGYYLLKNVNKNKK